MIGHDDKCINVNTWIMCRDFIPDGLNHSPRIIQAHFPIRDIAKQAFPILGANGHEIRTCLGIIISLQSNGTAMVNFRVVFHDNNPFCFSNPFNLSSAAYAACNDSLRLAMA